MELTSNHRRTENLILQDYRVKTFLLLLLFGSLHINFVNLRVVKTRKINNARMILD